MAALATVRVSADVVDPTGPVISRDLLPVRFAPGAGNVGEVTTVTLAANAFTAITVPAGAKAMLIELPTAAVSLTLKGVTGDSGISLTPATNFVGLPVLIPLGASPSVGILNGSSTEQTVTVTFL
jgi:hypothetical protein